MGKVLAMDEAMSAFVDKVFAPDRIKAAANTVSYTRSRIEAIFSLADRHIDHATRPEAAPEVRRVYCRLAVGSLWLVLSDAVCLLPVSVGASITAEC